MLRSVVRFGYLPVMLLGVNAAAAILAVRSGSELVMLALIAAALAVAVAVQLLLQHSNVDYHPGPLGAVLALNPAHRFHHLKWAGIGDVNFGLFTLIWDHLYRTYRYDPQRRFTSDDLGMAAKPNYPTSYLAQLTEPFRPSGACHANPAAHAAASLLAGPARYSWPPAAEDAR